MWHSPRRAYLPALLSLVAFTVLSAASATAKETVALTFGWPSGLEGKVAFSARTSQTKNGLNHNINLAGRYEFTTSNASDGLLIQFHNVETEVENSGSGPQAIVQKYMAKAASMPPSYVVNHNGEFVRTEGLQGFRDNIIDGMNEAFAGIPDQTREQVIQAMSAIFTKEQVEAGIVSEWNSYVGTWINAELDEGDVYELTFSQAIPAFGNMEVPMRSTFQFVRRLPCNGDKTEQDCVELEMHTFIDPDGLAAAVEAFVAKLPGGQVVPRIEELQQETVVRLVSEPGTLLPHLMESSTRSTTTVSVGDQSQSSSRTEEKRFVYTY